MKASSLIPVFLIVTALSASAQEPHTFDIAEVKKKAFHFGGYAEFRPVIFGLNKDSRFYFLKFYNQTVGASMMEYNFLALLDLSYEKGKIGAKIRTNTDVNKSVFGWSHKTTLFEALISIKPTLFFHIDAGKKRLRWGKGYAWNPVAFIDKPKDPNDPELALEGFTVISLDYTRSFKGALKTLSLTSVLLPVFNHINTEFGDPKKLNFGGKIYFLFLDTDIDLMLLAGGGVSTRYGFDFSRNITSNLEIHGEFACIPNFQKTYLNSNGQVYLDEYSSQSLLAGIRFLTKANTTIIMEYYRNGQGYTSEEMLDYYHFIDEAYTSFSLTGDEDLIHTASSPISLNYKTFGSMRDYLYLRISQKEPFNIIYFIPSLTSIVNLNDRSFSLSLELLYNPFTNMELRMRGTVLSGRQGSEFGERQNQFRIELRGRFYF